MAKDWDRYKTEIKTLYMTNGKSLDDVRRILKGRHNFEASIRAYRMKLEYWGIRKNKVPVDAGRARPRQKTKTNLLAGPSSGVQSSHNAANLAENNNFTSWPEFDNSGGWAPGLEFPVLNRPSLPMPPFQDSFNPPYIPQNRAPEVSSGPDLFKIISEGMEKDLVERLSFGASVNVRDDLNNSPLHAAIMKGSVGMAKALLKYGADVDAVGFQGKTPLHLSVVSKSLVQLVLKHHPNLSLQDDEGNTILHYLIRLPTWWSDLDIQTAIKSVLFAGVDINIQNNAGNSPLHSLMAETVPEVGYMETILEFLNCKPSVVCPMRNGQDLLRIFLKNTNIFQKSYYDWQLPDWVKVAFRCLEKFIAAGANLDIEYNSEPLVHYCLKSGKFVGAASESFLVHLVQKANISVPGSDGNYPLHIALARSTDRKSLGPSLPSVNIITAFIARQASVNQRNIAGASPLEIWLVGNRPQSELSEVTILLVEAGASTTVTTTSGKTLFDLIKNQSRECRILLTRKMLEADINAQHADDTDTSVAEWVEVWRSAWKQPLWNNAKTSLTKLEYLDFRPRSKNFMECAFVIIAEYHLERHRSRLKLFLEKNMEKEGALEDREEYCAILRDCRERKAEIDPSFYTFLLDIMDS